MLSIGPAALFYSVSRDPSKLNNVPDSSRPDGSFGAPAQLQNSEAGSWMSMNVDIPMLLMYKPISSDVHAIVIYFR